MASSPPAGATAAHPVAANPGSKTAATNIVSASLAIRRMVMFLLGAGPCLCCYPIRALGVCHPLPGPQTQLTATGGSSKMRGHSWRFDMALAMPSTPPKIRQVQLVGRKIRRLRKERHLTQTELSSRIGIQQSDLSRMEKGEYRVRL